MNTAIFSLIDAVLFRALPASHPEELVLLQWHALHRPKMIGQRSYGFCDASNSQENPTGCSFSVPFFNAIRSRGLFSGQAAFARLPQLNLSGNGDATIINNAYFVSGDFFGTIGVGAATGRTLLPADDRPEAPPALVVSYSYWQTALGGSPDVEGRIVKLNGQPFTTVGVAQPGFMGLVPGDQVDLWLPISTSRLVTQRWTAEEEGTSFWWLAVIGRRKPEISVDQAQAGIGLLFQDQTLHGEKPYFSLADAPGVDVLPAQQSLQGDRKRVLEPLYILMLAVALVLLIACANIAGLLLARATGRSKEIALRLTLGARRGRLVSQLLVESLMLSSVGGALGLILSTWGARALLAMADTDRSGPSPYVPHLDLRVLAFTAAVAVLTGVILGLVPALRSLRVDVAPALKTGGTSSAGTPRIRWYSMGNALVVGQVSLAIVALATAGLLVRTLRNLKSVTLGFDSSNLLVFHLDPHLAGYKGAQVDAMFRDLQEQFSALPGVNSVTYSWTMLLNDWEWATGIDIPGTPENNSAESHYMPVGPKFFVGLRIPFKTGRDLNTDDFAAAASIAALPPGSKPDPKGPPVAAIVNETFV